MSASARGTALAVLVRVEEGAYSNVVLPPALRESSLSTRDRAFVTDLVYSTLRQQRALDFRITPVLDRPLAELDPPVRAALRLGAYQLTAGVPAHAAVGETVAVVPKRGRPLVNAVLRRLAANGPPWPEPDGDGSAAVGARLSYPDWIVERLVVDLGRDDALAALVTQNEPPAVTLRPNPRRVTCDALAVELSAGGASVEPGRLGVDALIVRGLGDPATNPAVAGGRASPQDEASQAVVALLDPGPGDRVLDVAAAPGGKATAAAERVGDTGLVVAVDLAARRLALAGAAAARLGVAVRPVVADSRRLPVASERFDRVLVDAPCSGLGVLRRRPEARWRIQPGDVDTLAALQRDLVAAASGALRTGGMLVYSVCTVTQAETIAVDEWIARRHPDLVALAAPPAPWRRWGRGALLLPQDAGTDGMFVLCLQRGVNGADR